MLKPIGPYSYGAIGFGLMLVKYLVEYVLVVTTGGQEYGMLAFLSPIQSWRMESIANADSWVGWFILAWSLPFVFLAIWLSMRRAMDAGFSRAIVGGLLGYMIALATLNGPAWLAVALILPSSATIEHWLASPIEYTVVSVVEIDASPQDVWETVVAFPEIEHPPRWLHRLGVAYPVRARIEGQGVGAVRYCEFSTGDFVEPITVWDEPRRLAFVVKDQPCPMEEISPWKAIHPPHLHGFLTSHQGEFRLTETQSGGTRLEGRTWYSVDMYPQMYWKQWTDQIIHSIHYRVLEHIRDVVEVADR